MTDAFDRYAKLKREMDQARSRRDRNQGAAETMIADMAKQFDCRTTKEAEKLLRSIEKQIKHETMMFEEGLAKYEKEWGEK